MQIKVDIAIANYKQDQFLPELIESIKAQDYKSISYYIYNDIEGVGSGEAFNRAIRMCTGDVVVLMCADDKFTNEKVISDIVKEFEDENIGHVSRYYYQFIDGDNSPVRAWRVKDPIELANNPSGLSFRTRCIDGIDLTNKMFVEAPSFVSKVLKRCRYSILKYDTVAVRIHKSTARSRDYYLKMWKSSPVEEWVRLGGRSILKDYTSLIQIKNYFKTSAAWQEIKNFVRLRPVNLLHPGFWFYSIVALITPRFILLRLPEIYRSTFGKWTTREIRRP